MATNKTIRISGVAYDGPVGKRVDKNADGVAVSTPRQAARMSAIMQEATAWRLAALQPAADPGQPEQPDFRNPGQPDLDPFDPGQPDLDPFYPGQPDFDPDAIHPPADPATRSPPLTKLDLDEALMQARLQRVTTTKLNPSDEVIATAAKLRELYVLCPTEVRSVIPIAAASMNEAMTLISFRAAMRKYGERGPLGPRGGQSAFTNPADVWLEDKKLRTVQGLRMRPDQPAPLFEENGELWINTYKPPRYVHEASGGDVAVGVELMQQLVPDRKEQAYFWQLFAHKFRYPHIPGPAWVMVAADKFGTGRGMMIKLLQRLHGMRYVVEVPNHLLMGKSYQSQYNGWRAEGVIAYIEELLESSGTSKWATKRDAYEQLKTLVEVAPVRRRIVVQGVPAFEALICVTYVICTNHIDALPIPADDRRFAVFTNGEPREPAFWERVAAWLDDDANIAAFAALLNTVDLTGFSPFAVPELFVGKLRMSEAAESDLDRGMAEALHHLTGELLAMPQLINTMREIKSVHDYHYPKDWEEVAKRALQLKLFRIGERGGKNWLFEFKRTRDPLLAAIGRAGDLRLPVYARSERSRKKWSKSPSDGVRRELLRNGDPLSASVPGDVASGLRVFGAVFDVGDDK